MSQVMHISSCHLPFPYSIFESPTHTTHSGFIKEFPYITPASIDSTYNMLYESCSSQESSIEEHRPHRYSKVNLSLHVPRPIPQCQFEFRYGSQYIQIPRRQKNMVSPSYISRLKLSSMFRFGAPESCFFPFTFRFGSSINIIDQLKPEVKTFKPSSIARSTLSWDLDLEDSVPDTILKNRKRKCGFDIFDYRPNKKIIVLKEVIPIKRRLDVFRKENAVEEPSRKRKCLRLKTLFINKLYR